MAGLRTLLLELDTFPRPKPSGGAVAERTRALLGFPLPADIIERECFGARIHFRGRSVEIRKDRPIAVLVSRKHFDHYLADQAVQAGAVLRQGEPVHGVAVHPDRVEVRTDRERYEARCVVGADGANSVVGRTVRPLFSRDEIATALVGTAAADDEKITGRLDGLLEMYFGVAPSGYGWVFPHRGYYGVGVMGRTSDFNNPRKVFAAFAASLGLTTDGPLGHTIPWSGFARTVIGPRTLLVGDAAGLADPFQGEGVGDTIFKIVSAEPPPLRQFNDQILPSPGKGDPEGIEKELVQKHEQIIDGFLHEKLSNIGVMAFANDFEHLSNEDFLQHKLTSLQMAYGNVFVDLGVVDAKGAQLAYAGPFKLEKANYADAEWFQHAIKSQYYISDVFLGLRRQPHFIVAVKRESAEGEWILRATIDFVAFNTLVENIRIGRTGIAYILNSGGETSNFAGHTAYAGRYPRPAPGQSSVGQHVHRRRRCADRS